MTKEAYTKEVESGRRAYADAATAKRQQQARQARELIAGLSRNNPRGAPSDLRRFLPGLSSDWARLRFAGLEREELVVGKMDGVVNSAEKRAPSIEGGWRGKARSIICLHGSFEMTARLDADELTRAFDRDPKLANARGWASEQARYPGLVKYRISARQAILPVAFTRHAARAFDAGAKKLEFDIDVCLWATGKVVVIVEPTNG